MTLSLLQHLYRPHQLEWELHSRQRSERLEKLQGSRDLPSTPRRRDREDSPKRSNACCAPDVTMICSARTTYSAGVAHIFRDGSSQRWITTCITLPIQRTRCFAINTRGNPRPQFDWKQVDSRLVAPKRLTDGMRSWQEKCGLKKTLRALCNSRSGDYLARRSLFRRRGHLPPWRRYDKCSSTHFG